MKFGYDSTSILSPQIFVGRREIILGKKLVGFNTFFHIFYLSFLYVLFFSVGFFAYSCRFSVCFALRSSCLTRNQVKVFSVLVLAGPHF